MSLSTQEYHIFFLIVVESHVLTAQAKSKHSPVPSSIGCGFVKQTRSRWSLAGIDRVCLSVQNELSKHSLQLELSVAPLYY